AVQVATTLSKVFTESARSQQQQGKQSAYPPPVIVAETNTNSLIVKASPSDFTLISRMATDLDSKIEPGGGEVRIIAVHAGVNVVEPAQTVTKPLNELETNRQKMYPGYRPDPVTIEPDIRSNSLLVAASKGKFAEVGRLVADLEKLGPTGGVGASFIRTENDRPEDIKKIIEQMQRNRGSGRGDSRQGGECTRLNT